MTKRATILNSKLGGIGGSSTNFINYDNLANYSEEIEKDKELCEILSKVESLSLEWRGLQSGY